MINAKEIIVSIRDNNLNDYKKFTSVNVKDLVDFMKENINSWSAYDICIGEDGKVFYKQQNTWFFDYQYIVVMNSCYIDYRAYYTNDWVDYENLTDKELDKINDEIIDFVIEETLYKFIDYSGSDYEVELK